MSADKLESACDELLAERELSSRLRAQIKLLELETSLATRAIDSLVKMNEDLATECAFWKAAAERALRLWDTAQDEGDKLRDAIEVTLGSMSTTLSRENWTRLETALDE